jgi:hypothetical protein
LIGVEDNNHGHSTNLKLRELGYPHLYYRQDVDNRTRRRTAKLGWKTDSVTKPVMIDSLEQACRDGAKINCKETVDEMCTYVRDEKGEYGAQEGCFDDRVISAAIAQELRKRQGLARMFPSLNQ